ncbi:MAG: XRE family transcriptional regulator [Rhodobacteraceae bacterium]|nr:XRE family transcriptional regulator [Paracoccaceae bacterium]
MTTTPYASTRLAKFIDKRIGELHNKTQADIAREAGFKNANFITMLKTGSAKLALERVPSLAQALQADPAHLMRLALEQTYGPKMLRVFIELLGEPATANEKAWLALIRETSGDTDPEPSPVAQSVLKGVLSHGA